MALNSSESVPPRECRRQLKRRGDRTYVLKVKFLSWQEANAWANKNQDVYRCGNCGYYHLGKRKVPKESEK